MILFRPANASDLNDIHHLAKHSGAMGITTLPNDINLLKTRLAWSISSFNKNITAPNHDYYLFVLEDTTHKKVIGTSAIEAKVGMEAPFYSYKLSKLTKICHSLNIRTDEEILSLVNDYQGHSEICTLFLDPSYRKQHNGLLLSRARFLFIANHPHRFSPNIIAEMRGVTDDKGQSPFWDSVGSHFFHMSFSSADQLTLATDKQFIADLMPQHPIYANLLSSNAQAVIGKPHPSTIPAMNILLREGFRYNNYIDIFDGGPTIEAARDQIRTAALSKVCAFKKSADIVSEQQFMIATTMLNFKATVGPVGFDEIEGTCALSHKTAAILDIKAGDKLRITAL